METNKNDDSFFDGPLLLVALAGLGLWGLIWYGVIYLLGW